MYDPSVYILSKIPKHIWNAMPEIVKDTWYKEAYYFQGNPLQFAVNFITHIRNTPSEYKTELLSLLDEMRKDEKGREKM